MKNKLLKFLKKTLLIFPFGILIYVIISWTIFSDFISPLIFASTFSFIVIFYNWFEYEKYDKIELFDFLESQHSITVENNLENWENLNTVLDLQLAKIKSFSRTENFTKIVIEKKVIDTILILIKNEDIIEIRIRRKYLNFVPDMAENYRVINKITNGIKITTANNVYN